MSADLVVLDLVVHTIPYSAISTVSNLTKEFSCYVFEIGVACQEDVDIVIIQSIFN